MSYGPWLAGRDTGQFPSYREGLTDTAEICEVLAEIVLNLSHHVVIVVWGDLKNTLRAGGDAVTTAITLATVDGD